MEEIHRLKLFPRSPWVTPWRADTLVGMLCCMLARSGREADLHSKIIEAGSNTNHPASFFGHALYGHLKSAGMPPDSILFLGTKASAWHLLLELVSSTEESKDLAIDIQGYAACGEVTAEQLTKLGNLLETGLRTPIRCRLIPEGRNQREQLDTLQILSDNIDPQSDVSLDITHGLRHLPVLQLISGFFLRELRGGNIRAIYYAALDLVEDPLHDLVPVFRLDGLLLIEQWMHAVKVFKEFGDAGLIEPLLASQQDLQGEVRKLNFALRINQVEDAVVPAQTIKRLLSKKHMPLPGELFKEDLVAAGVGG